MYSAFESTLYVQILRRLYCTLKYIVTHYFRGRLMAKGSSTPMTIRIDDDARRALLIACEHEHRSQANMIEFLIIDYFRRNGMAYPPEQLSKID